VVVQGVFTLLSGIKNIPNIDLNAIVAMTDDGGSTGVLRDELGVLPPGDVRQCLVALSSDDKIMRELMNYRFESGGLEGHSFGNIFLAGLEKVTGSFSLGVEFASNVLKIKGRVLPVTVEKVHLSLGLKDGTTLKGEDKINNFDIESVGIEKIYIEKAKINPHTEKAILEADYIFIGPGNHYCSILPNLIVEGVKEAIINSKAKIIYIANLTNKKGHTLKYKLSNYVSDIEKYIGKRVDKILVNTEKPTAEQTEMYKIQEGDNVLVEDDLQEDERSIHAAMLNTSSFTADSKDKLAHLRAFIRHDSEKLAKVVEEIIA
jgi:uncharacterized cofD-like protein